MMRLATMTVIRGNGECEAIVNGVVAQEMRRMQEMHKKEMDTLDAQLKQITARRDKLLAENMHVRNIPKKTPLFIRIKDKIADIYALSVATIIVLGERLELWEYICDDEERM